jgi:transposase
MRFNYFIGIDVSKNNLDFCLLGAGKVLLHLQTENTTKSIEAFIRQIEKQYDFKLAESLFCMEHTGIYNYPLLNYLSGKQTSVWLESALHIRHSSGLLRGKNDKVDAERIAFYAYRNQDRVKLWQPARQIIKELKSLTALRSRLINVKKQLKTSLQEDKQFIDRNIHKKIQQCCLNSLEALAQDLAKVDKELERLIASDQELNRLFNLITSVEGIGAVTAREVLITTNEFKDFTEAKKHARAASAAMLA